MLAAVCAACALVALGSWLLGPGRRDRWSLESRALAETRHVLVRLPAGYRDTARYPLVVLLDGGDQRQYSADSPLFSRAAAVLSALEAGGGPQVILAGVENTDRVRDMTPVRRPDLYVGGGGSPAFLEFLESELVPFVGRRWKVGPVRILYGESYAGLFVLDALARGHGVFTDFIAVSPTVGVWPEGIAAALGERLAADRRASPTAGQAGPPRSLFVVYGEKDARLVTEHVPAVARLIDAGRPAALRFGVDIVPRAGHDPPQSFERGLHFVFGTRGE